MRAMASAELQLLKKAGRHAWRWAWWLVFVQVAVTAAALVGQKYVPKEFE